MSKDDFKNATREHVGPGGMKCACCGPAPGKDRKTSRRATRARLAEQTRRIVKEATA